MITEASILEKLNTLRSSYNGSVKYFEQDSFTQNILHYRQKYTQYPKICYNLRVASAPSSTAVTDSLDFQVADAPLQIQFA